MPRVRLRSLEASGPGRPTLGRRARQDALTHAVAVHGVWLWRPRVEGRLTKDGLRAVPHRAVVAADEVAPDVVVQDLNCVGIGKLIANYTNIPSDVITGEAEPAR